MLIIARYSAPELFGLPSLLMMIDEDYKNVGFCDRSQSEDESTRDRSINPTHPDGYLQLFHLYILPICNAYRYLNNFSSRVQQLYASQPIIYSAYCCNIVKKKNSAYESLSAISSDCLLLFTFLLIARKLYLKIELKRYSLFNRNLSPYVTICHLPVFRVGNRFFVSS